MMSPSQVDPMMINHTVPVDNNKVQKFLGMDTTNLMSADQMVNGLTNFSSAPQSFENPMIDVNQGFNQMPSLSPTAPMMNQAAPMMGTPQQMMGTPQPMMNQAAPMMGTPQPMMNQGIPMGTPQPMMGMASPQQMNLPNQNLNGLFNFTQ